MEKHENLFEEFPEVTREQWLARIEKDLRGKPYADLQWQLEEDILVEPFYVSDEAFPPAPPIRDSRPDNRWEVGEAIWTTDPKAANEDLLEGIDGGVEAPLIVLRHDPDDAELAQILDGLPLDRISTHFTHLHPDKQPVALLHQFRKLAEKWGFDPAALRGSIDYDPILDWAKPPYDQLAETLRFCDEHMPHFRMLQANGLRFHTGIENTSAELGYIVAKGSEYLAQMQQRGIAPATVNGLLQFTLAISTSYFVDIAKLRAFRRLWANVLAAYGAPEVTLPPIVAHLAQETQTGDPHTNMIRAGTQAMAAVLGGAARLYIRPANYALREPGTPFFRRIARNAQHILRLESYLDHVIDPAAGSYYIERLTHKLAEQAWVYFQKLEQQGEFA